MLSFHIKFVQTHRRTMVKQYAPQSLDTGGIKSLQDRPPSVHSVLSEFLHGLIIQKVSPPHAAMFFNGSKFPVKLFQQEDHDGPISLT